MYTCERKMEIMYKWKKRVHIENKIRMNLFDDNLISENVSVSLILFSTSILPRQKRRHYNNSAMTTMVNAKIYRFVA